MPSLIESIELMLDFLHGLRLASTGCFFREKTRAEPPGSSFRIFQQEESKFNESEQQVKSDDESKHQDIITQLIDMNLIDVAGMIFLNLSEIDVANALTSNPKWSAIATSRRRINQFFESRKDSSVPLKTFYRREELSAYKTNDSISSVFHQRACKKYSNISNKYRFKHQSGCDFCLEFSLEGATLFVHKIFVSDESIALVFNDMPRPYQRGDGEQNNVILLFDRWTFQFINSLSVCHKIRDLHFVSGINAIVITTDVCHVYVDRIILWDAITSQVHVLPISRSWNPFSKSLDKKSFCIGKLIVCCWIEGFQWTGYGPLFADVYKVTQQPADGSATLVRLVDSEPVSSSNEGFKFIRSESSLNCFLVYYGYDDAIMTYSLQVRSKEDFSLWQTVSFDFYPKLMNQLVHSTSFMLNDCLVFTYSHDPIGVNVISVDCNDLRKVYTLGVFDEAVGRPNEEPMTTRIDMFGRYLVLHCADGLKFRAAIWKLPRDFIGICNGHLNEGTVGVTSHCDELIVLNGPRNGRRGSENEGVARIDRFGISTYYMKGKKPTAVFVSMLNSIISDGEDDS